MIISLIGFMASGKTTVGKQLADRLNYEFIDLDQYIEQAAKMSIPTIFEQKGEKHFRTLEKKLLIKIINQHDKNLVISPGGGIIIDQENIELLKEKTIPFLLKASPNEIRARIDNLSERPLLNNKKPEETIKKLMEKRSKYYNQFENVINTDDKEVNEIVDEIINKLESLKWV